MQHSHPPTKTETMEKHRVEIFIDNESHISPHHTTGSALYTLGKVRTNYELLAERKRGDDVPVPNSTAPVSVREHERFHSVPIDLNPGAH